MSTKFERLLSSKSIKWSKGFYDLSDYQNVDELIKCMEDIDEFIKILNTRLQPINIDYLRKEMFWGKHKDKIKDSIYMEIFYPLVDNKELLKDVYLYFGVRIIQSYNEEDYNYPEISFNFPMAFLLDDFNKYSQIALFSTQCYNELGVDQEFFPVRLATLIIPHFAKLNNLDISSDIMKDVYSKVLDKQPQLNLKGNLLAHYCGRGRLETVINALEMEIKNLSMTFDYVDSLLQNHNN